MGNIDEAVNAVIFYDGRSGLNFFTHVPPDAVHRGSVMPSSCIAVEGGPPSER